MEELKTIYDSRDSFYKKAMVKEYSNNFGTFKELYSYNTLVGSVFYTIDKTITYNYYGKYSQTTTRHQKEFFKQEGLSDKEIKELFKNIKLVKEQR